MAADTDASLTVVAVGIARLGEAPVVATHTGGRAFQGTGRALSAAAGRLSYIYDLKARLRMCHMHGRPQLRKQYAMQRTAVHSD